MHGDHDRQFGPLVGLTLIHGLVVAGVAWLLLGGGGGQVAAFLPLDPSRATAARRWVLVVFSATYLVRFAVTGFVLLPRHVEWSEMAAVGPWLTIIHCGYALLGGSHPAPLGWIEGVGTGLYLFGSYLGTTSEMARQRWKADPAHQGKLYTDGFYRWCMHPNYLGDVLLFTGFALATGSPWALLIPVVMTATFLWVHIPTLDAYLAERYPEEFPRFASTRRSLFPGLW